MIKLKTLILENMVEHRLDDLIQRTKELPTLPDDPDNLFAPRNNKQLMLIFFNDVKIGLKYSNGELQKRLEKEGFNGTPEEIWKKWNSSNSPVRNYLLLPYHLRPDIKNWHQIKHEQDPDGKKHDLRLICPKCNNTETCKCSKLKREFFGLCYKCAGIDYNGNKI